MCRKSLATTDLSNSLSGYFPVLSLYNSILLLIKGINLLQNNTHKLEVQVARPASLNSFVYDLETDKKIQAIALKLKKSFISI